MTNCQNYQSAVQLSPQPLEDFQWWELHLSMEWEKLDHPGSIHNSNIRHFPTGLGSQLQWQLDQKSMVPNQAITPHQLLRASGSHTGSSDMHKQEVQHFNSPAAGQFYSNRMGDSITKFISANKRPLAV